MKKALYILLLLSIFCIANSAAQKVVRYPLFDTSQTPEFKVDSVVFRTDETLFYFHYDNREGAVDWINLSPETYIKDEKGKIYNILSLENIAKGPEQTPIRGKKDWNCILHFPRIDPKTKTIDFIEDESKTSFNIYGIDLSKDGEFPGYTDFVDFNRRFSHADFYFAASNYQKYIELATPLLLPAKTAFGKDGVINIIQNLIDSHVLTGKKDSNYDKYILEFRELCKKHGWAKGHENDLNCSLDLSIKLLDTSNKIYKLRFDNKLEEASSMLSEFIPLAELVYNSNDTIIAYHYGNYSQMLKQLGRNEESIIWGQKSIDSNRRLNNIGLIYHVMLSEIAPLYADAGNIDMANKCYEELYHLQEKEGGKYTFRHVQTAYNWGCDLLYNNKKVEGLEVLENAYNLYESSKMKMDSLCLSIAESISMTYYEMGNVQQSINVWENAMHTVKNRVGTKSSLYFSTIVGLAGMCRLVGNPGKASEYIYEIYEELKNANLSVEYISSLTTYANILEDIGDLEKSLNIYRITEDLYKKNNLNHDVNYGYLQLNLAQNYLACKDTLNSITTCKNIIETIYDRVASLNGRTKGLGENGNHIKLSAKQLLAQINQNSNPGLSATLCEEVILFNDENNDFIEGAKELAYGLIKQLYILHQDNPTVQKVYDNIVVNDNIDYSDRKSDALLGLIDFLKQTLFAGNVDEQTVQDNLHLIKDDQLRIIFDEFKAKLLNNILFLTEEQRESYFNAAQRSCFRPMFVSTAAEISQKGSLNAIAYDYLLLTKSILLASSTGLSDIVYQSNDKELIDLFERVKNYHEDYSPNQIESYEHDILRKSRDYSDFTKNLQVTWKDVQEKLNDNEVALEFFVERENDLNEYGVLLLRKQWEYPRFVDLASIELAIEEFGFPRMANIWKILLNEELIKEGDTIFMSGAGVLQTKWFEHLEMEPGVCFSDLCHVVRVTSTREIVRQRTTTEPERKSVILFGGLDYDDKETAETALPDEEVEIFRGEGDDRYRSGFERLIYSQKEIDAIQSIAKNNKIKCKEYQGRYGTEQAVRNLSGEEVGVLHFATHGLYYPENHPNVTNDSPYRQLFNNSNCLNRSFLVMSGGNALPQHKKVANSYTDGLLTAAEISHIDLHNVNLVVLSACQSAKGDISNEGVLGLQYGFKKAGVNSILMCLDNVDDHATQIFMEEFYKHLLKGLSKQESLKKAQQFMRTNTDEKYHSPEYWANYILLDSIE